MSPERWQKINEIFQSAIELEPGQQSAYLEKVCAEDNSLRQQVETLLIANDEAGAFIAGNAAEDAAHLLTLENSKTLTGESLGHYEIVSVLGSGGMGKVYLAKDSKLNRPVAVKTLPNSFSNEPDYVKRFQTEAKAAANLNHPNVATIYSVEETEDNQTFITMEYIEGKPLDEKIPANGLDQRTFLEWFIPIADALAHAHEKGILHRDIKPGNIMITPLGTPKILDFGLARIDKTKTAEHISTLNLTKTGQILGTPSYMSPEQAEGRQTDHRTDIFSLGVVMYEAITGEKPFKGDNYASIISDLLKKDPPAVAEVKPEVPYLLSRLIMKCLNKEPRFRYQSMKEVLVLLKEIKAAVESGATLSKPEQTVLSDKKNFLPWILAGTILLAATIGGFVFWNSIWLGSSQNVEVMRFHIEPPTDNPADLFNVQITPDGKNLVFPSKNEALDTLMLRPLDKYEANPIKGAEGGRDPFLSPDGKWLAFRYGLNSIRKVPLEGGVPTTVCDSCEIGTGVDWGEDNTIIFSDKTGIRRISADGGELETLAAIDKKAGETSYSSPIFLPEGRGIVFTVLSKNQKRLAVLSFETNEKRFLEISGDVGYPKYLSSGHMLFAKEKQIFAVQFDLETLKINGKPVPVLEDVFSFLPDVQIAENGTLIYLPATSLEENSLVWVDKTGQDSSAIKARGNYFAPKLSPDGTQVSVTVDQDVWVYDLNTERRVRLTTDGKSSYPLWTPDGEAIIYVTETENSWTIFWKNANGAGDAKRVFTSDFRIRPYSTHPTKNLIALTSYPSEGKANIVTLSLEDGKLETAVNAPFIADMPSFSPDGKWLAYFATESGKNQIFVQPFGENSDERFLVSEVSSLSPVWSKDGKKIYHRTVSNFYYSDIQTEPEIKIGETHPLFKGNYRTNFDLSADGEKFLLVKSEKSVFPNKLNVITNWLEEFREIMNSAK